MDPNDPFFSAARRQGIYSPAVEPRFDAFGGMFGSNPLVAMGMQAGSEYLMGRIGYVPGQFFPNQNLLDQMRAQQFQAERFRAAQAGFQQDRGTYFQMMGGLAAMTGMPFGLSQQRWAQSIAGNIASAMPYIAPMAPEFFDMLHGAAGSRGILADQVFRRGMHDVDPLTGRVGVTAATAGQRAGDIYQRLYGGGPAAIAAMRGIGAGAAGSLYAELQTRGLGGPSIGAFGAGDQATMLGGAARTDEALRSFDSAKAAERIKSMAGAVGAMRDIFGGEGRPNAPMSELLQAINNLTQNGLSTMAPEKIESVVRTTAAAARQAGVSINAVGGLLANGGATAGFYGLDQAFAAPATTSSLLFGAAFRDVGRGDVAAFGRRGVDHYVVQDQKLRLAASQSATVNMIAALGRYQEEVGGLRGDAADYLQAVKEGRTDGMLMSPSAFMKMFREGGASAAAVQSYIGASDANKAFAFRNNLGDYGRQLQTFEVQSKAGQSFAQALMSGGVASDVAKKIGGRLGRGLFGLDREVSADSGKTIDALIGQIRNDPALAGLGDRELRELVGSGLGNFSSRAEKDLGRNLQETLDLFNPRLEARRRARAEEAAQEADLSKALSGLGRSGPMARLADLVKNPAANFTEGVAQFLGGIKVSDISGELDRATTAGQLAGLAAPSRLAALGAGVRGAIAAFGEAGDGAGRAALTGGISAMISGSGADRAMEALMRQYNVTPEDLPGILSGKSAKVPPNVREVFRGLAAAAGGGINSAAEAAGVAVGSKVTAEEFKAAGDKLSEARRLALDAGRSDKDDADARKLSRQGLASARGLADLILGDEKSLDAAGPGAFAAARGVRAGGRELEAMAKANGMSAEDLLNYRGDDKATLAASVRARGLRDRLMTGVDSLRAGLARGGKAGGESAAEKDAWRKFRDAETLDEGKLNELAIRDALAVTGGTLRGDEEVREIAGKLGTGEAGDRARAYLKSSLGAVRRLRAGGQTAAERAADLRMAGPTYDIGTREQGGLGADPASTAEALKDTIARASSAAKSTQPQKMVFEFAPGSSVSIEGNRINFGGVRASGSTPPVG